MKLNMKYVDMIYTFQVLDKFTFVKDELGHAIYQTKERFYELLKPFNEKYKELVNKYNITFSEDGSIADNENIKEFFKAVDEISEESTEVEIDQVEYEAFKNTDIYNRNCSVGEYDLIRSLFVKQE